MSQDNSAPIVHSWLKPTAAFQIKDLNITESHSVSHQIHSLQLSRCRGTSPSWEHPAPQWSAPALRRQPSRQPFAARQLAASGEPIAAQQRAGPQHHSAGHSKQPWQRHSPRRRGGHGQGVNFNVPTNRDQMSKENMDSSGENPSQWSAQIREQSNYTVHYVRSLGTEPTTLTLLEHCATSWATWTKWTLL